ncbi:LysR family substrate-binding domain-containing protein [Nonomuraea sp. NN258]|nr:LysR family substrate-binding domain-containing protein [Nonomuraea antri]
MFRLAYAPGVTPAKWVNVWCERIPGVPVTLSMVPAAEVPALLLNGEADAGFVRLPVDRDRLSAIPLYVETTVVVVPKDHAVTAAEEVTLADLADDEVLHPLDDTIEWTSLPGLPAFTRPDTTADAIGLVASGAGLLLVPQSLARLHHRKDLKYRPVTDAPQSQIALAWPTDATTDLVEDFIGIVRGRTVNSSRGRTPAPHADKQPQRQPQPKSQSQSQSQSPSQKRARTGSTPRRSPQTGRKRKGPR